MFKKIFLLDFFVILLHLVIPVSQKSRKTIARLWDRDWSLETATLMQDYQKYDILENKLLHNNIFVPECSRSLYVKYQYVDTGTSLALVSSLVIEDFWNV